MSVKLFFLPLRSFISSLSFEALPRLFTKTILMEEKQLSFDEYNPAFIEGWLLLYSLSYEIDALLPYLFVVTRLQ